LVFGLTNQDGTSTDSASSVSSTSSASATSGSDKSHPSGGIKRPIIIAIVIVALIVAAIIGVLLAYIFMLRKNAKNAANANSGQPTELNKISTTISNESKAEYYGKSELPSEGNLAWELPSTPASGHPTPVRYDQQPGAQQAWSPHTPSGAYPHTHTQQFGHTPTQPYSALELPASNRRSSRWGGTSELPG
jgi:hypothetical protein